MDRTSRNAAFRGMDTLRLAAVAAAGLLAALLGIGIRAEEGDLLRMEYNNPGLTDFLAVGLWSWPVPCDVDDDGDTDLIVSCEDTPYNGTYLFENPGPADEPFPDFKKAKRLSAGVINVQASWVDGRLRVMTPKKEYPDFINTGVEHPV
ncbi:MAG: hypothetical protein IJG02_09470, partial [Thermoguttaceae bacterium]|nr:hypothetical protein [Thermoguttaceae bacterium]